MGRIILSLILVSLVFLSGCCDKNEQQEEEKQTIFKNYFQPNLDYVPIDYNETQQREYIAQKYTQNNSKTNYKSGNYLIGAYYIDNFNQKKADSVLMGYIIDIIKKYDIMLIQDINDNNGEIRGKFNDLRDYQIRFSKDYLFVINNRIQINEVKVYEEDDFSKNPILLNIKIDKQNYTLIGLNTQKENNIQELQNLPKLIDWSHKNMGKYNIIILGNLNLDCVYFNDYYLLEGYILYIKNDTTTNNKLCAYDRFILTEQDRRVIDHKVDNIIKETNGDMELIRSLSNHYPIMLELQKD